MPSPSLKLLPLDTLGFGLLSALLTTREPREGPPFKRYVETACLWSSIVIGIYFYNFIADGLHGIYNCSIRKFKYVVTYGRAIAGNHAGASAG
jgi:hypothetical protein